MLLQALLEQFGMRLTDAALAKVALHPVERALVLFENSVVLLVGLRRIDLHEARITERLRFLPRRAQRLLLLECAVEDFRLLRAVDEGEAPTNENGENREAHKWNVIRRKDRLKNHSFVGRIQRKGVLSFVRCLED